MFKTAATHLGKATWSACCLAACSGAAAQGAASEPQASASQPLLIGVDLHTPWRSPRSAVPLWARDAASLNSSRPPMVTIVTLPPEPVPGRPPGRSHHALSISNESSKQALRSMGLAVSDCATRFRLPTRFRQNAPGTATTLDAQAQVSWVCHF